MRMCIKSNVIDIKILKDLKSKFDVHYDDTINTHLILDGSVVTYIDHFGEYFEIDCSHWIEKIKNDKLTNITFSEVIEQIINSVGELKLMQIK